MRCSPESSAWGKVEAVNTSLFVLNCPRMATEQYPGPEDWHKAALAGLATVPPAPLQQEQFSDAVAKLGPLSEVAPHQIRRLGASALRSGLYYDVESGAFNDRARQVLHKSFADLDADDVANTAFESLHVTVQRYEDGIGVYGGDEPQLFPVEKHYFGWTRGRILRAARDEVAQRRSIPGEIRPIEPPPPAPSAPDVTAVGALVFIRARDLVLHSTPLHPDLAATLAGRRTESAMWRERWTKLAAVDALNHIENGLSGEPASDPATTARRALRVVAAGTMPTVKALDKRVSRYVADVLYAVAESLRPLAAGPAPAHPLKNLVWRYLTLEVIRWHAAQLPATVGSLVEGMRGEITTDRRLTALRQWTSELIGLLRSDTPHHGVVELAAQQALGECRASSPAPSPIERAVQVSESGPPACRHAAQSLISLHDALADFLSLQEVS